MGFSPYSASLSTLLHPITGGAIWGYDRHDLSALCPLLPTIQGSLLRCLGCLDLCSPLFL